MITNLESCVLNSKHAVLKIYEKQKEKVKVEIKLIFTDIIGPIPQLLSYV